MSAPIPKVSAGELITAQFMNQVIDAMNDLARRVEDLEGAGAVLITEIEPAGSLRMLEPVRVSGRNFGLPSQTTVYVDSAKATLKAGSGDRLLLFDLPTVTGVPDSGRDATLRIATSAGAVTETIHILPPLPLPSGLVFVSVKMPNEPIVYRDKPYQFEVTARITTSQNETFTIGASAGTTQGSWVVSVTDTNLAPLDELFVAKTGTTAVEKKFYVLVTVPKSATGDARFNVDVVSSRNPTELQGSTGEMRFKVGDTPSQAETFDVALDLYEGITQVVPDADGVLQLKAGTAYSVRIVAVFPVAGKYKATFGVADRPDLWLARPGFSSPVDVPAGQVTLDAVVRGPSGAPATTLSVRFELDQNVGEKGRFVAVK